MNPFHVSKEQVIEKNIAALRSSSMKKLSNEEVIALGQYLGFAPLFLIRGSQLATVTVYPTKTVILIML